MDRRSFVGSALVLLASLWPFGRERKRPLRKGDVVKILSHPDPNAVGRGAIVLGPIPNPPVMNEHYVPHLQLWSVDSGMFRHQVYEHELERREAR